MWPGLANTCPGHNRLNANNTSHSWGMVPAVGSRLETSIAQMTRNWKQLHIKQSDVKLSTVYTSLINIAEERLVVNIDESEM